MFSEKGFVRRLDKNDAEAVYAVRMEAYRSSKQFKVLNFSSLEWNQIDDRAIVLGAFSEGKLVASLRAEIINSREVAEDKLKYVLPVDLPFYPTLLLGRGATMRAYRNYGFNSILRYYFLGLAIDFPFQSFIGSVFEKAPRIGLMRDLGYRFTIPHEVWDEEIKALTREYFVYIQRNNFLPAFNFLGNKFAPMIERYPWVGLI